MDVVVSGNNHVHMPTTAASAPTYLLLHGFEHHKPQGHWLVWLAAKLHRTGARVRFPQLPDADRPDRHAWGAAIDDELAGSAPDGVTVICHSLGVAAWLRAPAIAERPVKRVLLVAPPSARVLAGISEIADFAIVEFSPAMIAAATAVPTLIVAADNDPYCPEGALVGYGEPLGIEVNLVPGAGHFDLAAGYGAWPSVLRWCLDPRAAITARDNVE